MNEGDVFRVRYPFVRCWAERLSEDGLEEFASWRPGTEVVNVPPDDCETVAHAEGEMVLTVVSVHKPGHYPTRVFYTRRWVRPDGGEFGKGRLLVCTLEKFRRISSRYQHDYGVRP